MATKGSKTNPTRDRGEEVVSKLMTSTRCDHCGEPIPSGQVVAVKRTTFNGIGGSRTRTYRFMKGHPTETKVA